MNWRERPRQCFAKIDDKNKVICWRKFFQVSSSFTVSLYTSSSLIDSIRRDKSYVFFSKHRALWYSTGALKSFRGYFPLSLPSHWMKAVCFFSQEGPYATYLLGKLKQSEWMYVVVVTAKRNKNERNRNVL